MVKKPEKTILLAAVCAFFCMWANPAFAARHKKTAAQPEAADTSSTDEVLPQPDEDAVPVKNNTDMQQPVEPGYASVEAGIIMLAQSGGTGWQHKLEKARAVALDRTIPVYTVYDPGDQRALQAAVDKIDARGVKRIIVIPALTTATSEALDQARYLFGFVEKPSKSFLTSPHVKYNASSLVRIKTKTPVVITGALDASAIVSATLGGWVESYKNSVDGAPVSLVVAGLGPDDEKDYASAEATLSSIAIGLLRKYQLEAAHAVLLRANNGKMESAFGKMTAGETREKLTLPKTGKEGVSAADAELRKAVADYSKTSKVLVLAYSLSDSELDKMVKQALTGTFYTWSGTVTLSQPQVEAWLKAKLAEGLQLKPQARYIKPAVSIDGKKSGLGMINNSGTLQ